MRKESLDAFSKRKLRESAEVSKLELAQRYHQGKFYLAFLVVVLTIVFIVVEMTFALTSAMQPYAIIDLYKLTGVLDANYPQALFKLTLMLVLTLAILLVVPFYKSLADKYGRKLFLVINTLALALGLFMSCIAFSPIIYVLAFMTIVLFSASNIQSLYILEYVKEKNYKNILGLIKVVSLLACCLIGVSRSWFYNPEVVSSWRYVYYLTIVVTLIVSVISIFLVYETPVYTANRLEYLRKNDEQRKNERFEKELLAKEQKQINKENSSLLKAIKYIFSNHKFRNITLALLSFSFAISVIYSSATILQASVETNILNNDDLNLIYFLFPLVNGLTVFIGNFISSKLDIKKSTLIFGVISIFGLIAFVLGTKFGFLAVVVASGFGLFIGGLWIVLSNLYQSLSKESEQSNLQVAIIRVLKILFMLTMILSIIIVVAINLVVKADNLGILSLCLSLPLMILGLYLLIGKAKKSKVETEKTELKEPEVNQQQKPVEEIDNEKLEEIELEVEKTLEETKTSEVVEEIKDTDFISTDE